MFKNSLILFIAICLFMLTSVALSQNNNLMFEEFKSDSASSSYTTSDTPPDLEDSDVKLFIDKIEVQGQLERPQALFILPGSTPDIDDIQIEHSFFKEIFRPVEKRGRIQTKITTDPTKDRKDYIPW